MGREHSPGRRKVVQSIEQECLEWKRLPGHRTHSPCTTCPTEGIGWVNFPTCLNAGAQSSTPSPHLLCLAEREEYSKLALKAGTKSDCSKKLLQFSRNIILYLIISGVTSWSDVSGNLMTNCERGPWLHLPSSRLAEAASSSLACAAALMVPGG